MPQQPNNSACASCAACPASTLQRRGEHTEDARFTIALAGNPNTGKSTVFNALTGLKQHTGNWPGKTVGKAEGSFAYADDVYTIVDLPGTYSLSSTSEDEEIARDFILFSRPDVTVVVADATRLERNMNLLLQVLQITDKAVLCVNLLDEARRNKIEIDLNGLSRRLGIPVVEVIQPAVRRAVAATRNGRIGVIGTLATVGSRAYEDSFSAAPHLQVVSAACPRFVEFVEAGITTGPELLATAEEYVAPLQAAGVDTLVLGCTHYPLLTGALSLVMGDDVTLVSSAEETAKDLYRALVRHGLEHPHSAAGSAAAPQHRFAATGDPEHFQALARRFLGPEVGQVRRIDTVRERYPTAALTALTPDVLARLRAEMEQEAAQ